MKKSSLIGHVVEAFDLIHSQSDPADRTLHAFFREHRYLGSNDRRFIADTVYGMIREERSLRYITAKALPGEVSMDHLQVRSILLYLVYAVRFLSLEPAELVADVAGLPPNRQQPDLDLGGFLDAVGSVTSPMSAISDPVLRLAITFSIPEFVIKHWNDRLGHEECSQLCAALNNEAPVAIRVNSLRGSVEACGSALAAEGVPARKGDISPEALVLQKRISVQSLKSFRDGLFEMQDEGSQLIAHLVSPLPGESVADACAGGGGKSLHLAALMDNRGTIFASDVNDRRLKQALLRAERAGVKIMRLLASGQDGLFDRVLVDAPCSGNGTWRRSPWAKNLLTPEMVTAFSERQRTILQDSSALVRKGGRLVYATCSLLAAENEEVVGWFVQRNPDFSILNATEILRSRGITRTGNDELLSLMPHRDGTDGFFAAAMERSH